MESIALESVDGVALLRIQRPPVNAINLEVVEAVAKALEELTAAEPSAVVLTGSGQNFSAGLDLKEVTGYSPEKQNQLLHGVNRMAARLYGFPAPVIGAINGHAIAAGFCLATICDYRIGVRGDAKVGLTEARVGIPFPAVPMAIIRQELEPSALRRLMLLAQNVTPEEALRCGVFDELAEPDALMDRALEVAKELAGYPRDGYVRIKHQLRKPALDAIADIIANDTDPMLNAWQDQDAAGASAAVLDKRK